MEHEYTFNGQRDNEKVLHVIKNHSFVLLVPGIKAVLLIAVGLAFYIYIQNQYIPLLTLIFLLVGAAEFLRALYIYNQSSFLITNQRVINVGQEGYFKRKITETEISNIQDVSSDISGAMQALFKFGNLNIRTAGATDNSQIVVKDIANPYDIQQAISKMLRK